MSHVSFGRRLSASPSLRIGVGLAIGQSVVYAATPLITRLYSTSEVGHGGLFLAAASILSAVSTLRLEVVLPRGDDQQARWAVALAVRSILVVAVVGGVAYAVSVRAASLTGGLLAAVTFGACVAGLGLVALVTQWSARTNSLDGLAASKVVQGLGQTGVQLLLGASRFTAFGLQIGFAVGYLLSAGVQAGRSMGRGARMVAHRLPWAADRRSLLRHSLLLSVATLVNLATVWSYPLLLRWFYGVSEVGVLTVAQRLAIAPAGLAVAAITPVVAAAAGARLRAQEDVWPVARTWLLRLLPLGLVSGGVLLLLPADVLVDLLGPGWGAVRSYLVALSPLIGTLVVVGPVSQLLSASGYSGSQLAWDCTRFVAAVLAFAVAAELGAPPARATLYSSVVLAVAYVAYVAILHRRLNDALRSLL